MSQQEKNLYIEKIRNALHSYRGFTDSEKDYANRHLPMWVEGKGELELFIKKFSEKFSLDVQPFLFEHYFLKRA